VPVTKPIRTYIPNYRNFFGNQTRFDKVFAGSRTGESVPGWRKAIKEGRNATSPYSVDRYSVKDYRPAVCSLELNLYQGGTPPIFIGTQAYSIDGYNRDLGPSDLDHLAGISADAEAQALKRLYGRIRQESYGVNGLLFLGELRETIQLIRRPASAIQDLTRDMLASIKSTRKQVNQKIRPRKAETLKQTTRRRLDAVKNATAGTWLEYQFGVKPAISDVQDIAATAIDSIYGRSRKTRVRGKSTDTLTVYKDSGDNNGALLSCLGNRASTVIVTNCGVQYIVGLSQSADGPVQGLDALSKEFGFQIQNFVPTIYELIPYSFLIDYFVNLGDVIEAACTDTSKINWICRTQRQLTSASFVEAWSAYDENGYPGYHHNVISGQNVAVRQFEHVTISRTKPSSLPLPPLVLSVPGTDSTKWYNMAALLGQSRGFRFR